MRTKYEYGKRVTFLQASNSGQCFDVGKESRVLLMCSADGSLLAWDTDNKLWHAYLYEGPVYREVTIVPFPLESPIQEPSPTTPVPEGSASFIVTRPALERLLGGDSELEIKVRQQAAEQIAKKYLSKAISEEVKKELQNEVRVNLRKEWNEYLNTQVYSFRERARLDALRTIDDEVKKKVSQRVDEFIASDQDTARLKNHVLQEVRLWVKKELSGYVKEMVTTQISETIAQHVLKNGSLFNVVVQALLASTGANLPDELEKKKQQNIAELIKIMGPIGSMGAGSS